MTHHVTHHDSITHKLAYTKDPVLHAHPCWPLPMEGMEEPEPEPEIMFGVGNGEKAENKVWKLCADQPAASRESGLTSEMHSQLQRADSGPLHQPPTLTKQLWPLQPAAADVSKLDLSQLPVPDSPAFTVEATPGDFFALPGERGRGARTYDTWLDHSTSAIFLSDLLNDTGVRSSSSPSRAQTPDLGPPRTAALSELMMEKPPLRHTRRRSSTRQPPAWAGKGPRPWTAEKYDGGLTEDTGSVGHRVRVTGTTTGGLQMSLPLERELERAAIDQVSRQVRPLPLADTWRIFRCMCDCVLRLRLFLTQGACLRAVGPAESGATEAARARPFDATEGRRCFWVGGSRMQLAVDNPKI